MVVVTKRIDWLLGATIGLCCTVLAFLGIALGALILAVPSLFLFQDRVIVKIAEKHPDFSSAELPWLAAILVGAAVIVGLIFLFIKTLLDIVRSVGTGDPLTTENAARLEKMGWLAVGIEGVGLVAAMVAWRLSRIFPEIDWDFDLDLSSVILVLLLFILARVFRNGAAMRAELEGTV